MTETSNEEYIVPNELREEYRMLNIYFLCMRLVDEIESAESEMLPYFKHSFKNKAKALVKDIEKLDKLIFDNDLVLVDETNEKMKKLDEVLYTF